MISQVCDGRQVPHGTITCLTDGSQFSEDTSVRVFGKLLSLMLNHLPVRYNK
jgi:hypothetical protein